MPDITYTPQYQPPVWKDNVDLMLADGPKGFNIQFKSLRDELDRLSTIVKMLNDAITGVSQTLSTQITSVSQTANAANTAAQAASTANTANSTIQPITWGFINPSGTIISGSKNFTVTRRDQGVFDITFNPVFGYMPTFLAMPYLFGPNYDLGGPTLSPLSTVIVINLSPSQCSLRLINSVTGESRDTAFTFIAYYSS